MRVSEGIAEGIALTLNRHELSDDDYNTAFEGAAEAAADEWIEDQMCG